MIAAETFDIQKGPVNSSAAVGTCLKLLKANPEQLQRAGVCMAEIKITLFCRSCY